MRLRPLLLSTIYFDSMIFAELAARTHLTTFFRVQWQELVGDRPGCHEQGGHHLLEGGCRWQVNFSIKELLARCAISSPSTNGERPFSKVFPSP